MQDYVRKDTLRKLGVYKKALAYGVCDDSNVWFTSAALLSETVRVDDEEVPLWLVDAFIFIEAFLLQLSRRSWVFCHLVTDIKSQ